MGWEGDQLVRRAGGDGSLPPGVSRTASYDQGNGKERQPTARKG